MKNVAYTSEYQNYRNQFDYIFCEKYLTGTRIIELSQEYSIKANIYEDPSSEVVPYRTHCSTACLLDKSSATIFSIRNINIDGSFYNLIKHSNGNNYLVFRIDLYGYSMLDLCTMKDYHYIPEKSFRGGETFIWTGTHYISNTNLLIAEGCYWACPYSLFVIDFSNPVNLPYPMFDINDHLDYEDYEDTEFVDWDNTDNLIIKCNLTEITTTKVIEKDICIKILKSGLSKT